jgi:hypothetical protein
MTLAVPSTTVKAHFLQTLPLQTVYKDPRNNHVYEVQEKQVDKAYSKIAVPYFRTSEPIELNDISDKHLKLENPNRANIMLKMKQKLNRLEALNAQLMAFYNFNIDTRFGRFDTFLS